MVIVGEWRICDTNSAHLVHRHPFVLELESYSNPFRKAESRIQLFTVLKITYTQRIRIACESRHRSLMSPVRGAFPGGMWRQPMQLLTAFSYLTSIIYPVECDQVPPLGLTWPCRVIESI
jgi:hypothetical protein